MPEHRIDLLDYYDVDDPRDVQFLHETLLRSWRDREPFWAQKSRALFVAAGKCATATGTHPLKVLAEWVQLAAPTALERARVHAPVEVSQFLGSGDSFDGLNRFAQSAWGTLTTRLIPLIPHITTVTTSEIPPTWMAERGTVYLTYPLDHLAMAGSLVAAVVGAFVNGTLRAQTRGQARSRTLFVLDELPTTAMPRLDEYLSGMSGVGATALLYLPSLAHLDQVYGAERARAILANCDQQVVEPPRDGQVADLTPKRD